MTANLVFTTAFLSIIFGFVVPEEWVHHTVLDGGGRYHLYWNPPELKNGDSNITFKVEVETHGYVGFGLSPNGGMAGSDIVTGWIKDSKVYFQDRHGTGNELPKTDREQDWEILDGNENDTHTILVFRRKLDTCDEEDMVIDDSTMRLIYAFSEEDPPSDDPVYHSGNRGVKSAMLLQSKVERQHHLDDPSILQWDLRTPNFTIPTMETMYWCRFYKTPEINEKHHIVYVKPIIEEGHEKFVHHMLLYECVGAEPEEYDQYIHNYTGHQCHHPNMPDAMKKCEGVSIAWAVGGNDVVFPDHVGFPLDPIPGKYFLLEIHYDNQDLQEGVVDNSGLRIYYTPKLRKYDAGCLMLGSTISRRVFIPPGQKEYTVTGHSNPDCLAPDMPKGGIKALGVLLHSHLIGKRIIARHYRKYKELAPLAVEKNYDFNYQDYRYYTKEVDIRLGDHITVECTYDSSKRLETTFGGESTQEEMCLAFVLYYPRINRYASLSVPTIANIDLALNTNLSTKDYREIYPTLLHYNFKNANIKQVEDLMMHKEHNTHCYLGNGNKNSIKSLISYPTIQLIYGETSVCQDHREAMKPVTSGSTFRTLERLFILISVLFFVLFV